MKYTRYPFLTDQIIRDTGKLMKINKKDRKKLQPELVLQEIIKDKPEFLVQQQGHFVLYEWEWKKSEKIVVYPVDTEILDIIANGRYEVSYPKGITPFASTFIMHFPTKYRLAGLPAVSVLVNFRSSADFVDNLIKPFLEDLDLQDIEEYQITGESHELIMDLVYFKNDKNGKKALYRDHVPWGHVDRILRDKEFGSNTLESMSERLFPLDEDEIEYRYALIRLIVAMLVYVQASSGALVDGFPGVLQLTTEGQYFKNFGKTINKALGKSSKISTKKIDGHYRAWHIRQLRDERYYQREWSDKPRGSRLVFVSDTYVGDQDVNPKTLKDSNLE